MESAEGVKEERKKQEEPDKKNETDKTMEGVKKKTGKEILMIFKGEIDSCTSP